MPEKSRHPKVMGTLSQLRMLQSSSGGGGSHNGVLWVRTEDGSWQSHDQRRGLDDDNGVLALRDAGLIAAADQWDRATGLARQALVVAGHVLGQEMHLGERARRKQSTGTCEEQNIFIQT